ncbi:hypothetical protein GCM10008014_52430 [Paenibacillus silvae]|uniref:AsqO/PenF-like C-terminal domain-containing protein n=1 Tax=Paenibacillus silvae TaxID=1325358 RepID=A0ABQ1ZMW5_9BACL|nr:lipocalin-like domain-containing protein [Paenibacillus silvae]GGH69241.1 hypothetical protein GCM10008014_52430 [Paenibacillus silvae]
MKSKKQRARLANEQQFYNQLHIHPDQPHPKEDGMRTEGKAGSYEWWYTDAEFEDGTTIVTIFYTKNHFDVPGPAWPRVDIDITHPDGTKTLLHTQLPKGQVLIANREYCDVHIGRSYIRYKDGNYVVHFEEGGVVYDALMTSKLPMWRPESGHWLYGGKDEHYFAWFVAQPSASIEATLTIHGQEKKLTGTGYHDHNWGNISMDKLMNHWYWGRAKVGEYDIIACDIIAEKKYNYQRLPVFMLAKDEKIITGDSSVTQITRQDTIQHPTTKKFMDNHLIYHQPISATEAYTVEFIRHRDIVSSSLLDTLGATKAKIARLLRANPTYTRVLGQVRLTHEVNGTKTVVQAEGLWEQMFFGSNKHATIQQ